MNWKRILAVAVFGLAALFPTRVGADLFGGDVVVLTQILANAISQLAALRSILQTGSDELGLVRDINRGINDSLTMAQTLGIHVDPGLYGQVATVSQGVALVEQLFGHAVDSPLAPVQRNTDQTVAEAISFNNELYAYADQLDRVGESIKSYSHAVSPGGATKLTAESIGVLIHVMNQQMRATGHGLKLQAQALAMQNKKEKDQTEEYLKEGEVLKAQMTSAQVDFQVPRF